jgi:hypothetical protein
MTDDELRLLRNQVVDLERALSTIEAGNATGGVTKAVRISNGGAWPASGFMKMFLCVPVQVTGQETEGLAGTVSNLPGSFLALNLGRTSPPIGTEVLVTDVGTAWVFRYD